jgi:ferric-dicitrate binding protein FerR (iron transport regulator)
MSAASTHRASPSSDREFAQRLREEAHAYESKFSEAVHRRICDAVLEQRVPGIKLAHADNRPGSRVWAALASAAVILLAITLAWRFDKPVDDANHSPSIAAGNLPREILIVAPDASSLPVMVDRAALRVDRMLDDELLLEQWAYLEHDARVLAYAVTGDSLRAFLQPADSIGETERQ